MAKIIFALFCVLSTLGGHLSDAAAAEGERLLKIVALSRHGVRAPTQSQELLDKWSLQRWPAWPVKRGELTRRGASLVDAMWGNLRQLFVQRGLLTQPGEPSEIYVRADTDQRTQATAAAILRGLRPASPGSFFISRREPDPLFHPVRAGLYAFDPTQAATSILSMTGGGLEQLQETYAGTLTLLGRICGPLAPGLCARNSLPPGCHVYDLPNSVSVSADGRKVGLSGALGIASSLSEIFLLEYAQWPNEAAAWGQVDATTLSQILAVHSRVFNVVNRAPLVAWARGSGLLVEMMDSLLGAHRDTAINAARLVIFVGHDTNLANIGALLGIRWRGKGYPLNGIPPASVLFAELWENGGRKEVRLCFYVQPPAALHAPFAAAKEDPDARAPALTEKALAVHAPAGVAVSAPPMVGEARFGVDEFVRRVEFATAGATLPPPGQELMPVEADADFWAQSAPSSRQDQQ